jgi:hypothetical protein
MKEHELIALMERAGDGLAPDVDALVTGGTARGRRALRRRRLAGGLGAVAAVGAIAVAATVLSGGGGTPPTVPDVVDTPSTTVPADGRPALADDTVIEERLLDALPDGEVTDLTVKTHTDDDGDPIGANVHLLLDGAEVAVSIDDTSRDPADVPEPGARPTGCNESQIDEGNYTISEFRERLLDPEFLACIRWSQDRRLYECAQEAACWKMRQAPPPCNEAGCVRFPDGSWLRSGTEASYEDDADRPTEWPRAWATRATADHWWLSVGAGGSAKWAAPILNEEQVAMLAKSGIWFE